MDTVSYLLGKKAGGGGSDVKVQNNKSVTITENTTTTINPDTGYDALKKVEVTTNVSGGTPVVPKTKTELTTEIQNSGNAIVNALFSTKDNYSAYINNSITLYTPDIECKGYMIQKKSNGKYRIVWGDYDYIRITSLSNQSFVVTRLSQSNANWVRHLSDIFDLTVQDDTSGLSQSNYLSYYSNDFNTLEELVQAIQNSNSSSVSYSKYISGLSFGGITDSTFTTPITNLILFDNNWGIVENGTILSKNEEIITYPS